MEQVLQSSIPVTPSTGYEYDVTCSGGYSFDDVMRVTSSNDEMMVQWCQFIQLIPQCVSCPKCANKMHLAKSSSVWRCNRTNCHGQELSVRNGTIFSKSKLSIKLIIRVMYFFATKKSVKDTAKDLKIPNKTVSKWFSVFRDICSKEILPCDFKVGGRGRTVEIDETSLKKNPSMGEEPFTQTTGFLVVLNVKQINGLPWSPSTTVPNQLYQLLLSSTSYLGLPLSVISLPHMYRKMKGIH